MPDQRNRSFAIHVKDDDRGKRLDAFIAAVFPEVSRSTISRLIRNGDIKVTGGPKKPGFRINAGDIVSGIIYGPTGVLFQPEPIDLDIIFEDSLFLVINKPPGIVVHPSPGHEHGTLANGLLFHRPQIQGVGEMPTRPGIVHRLDKDTSGILVIAKTDAAYHYLIAQFKNRTIGKTYLGIVFGVPDEYSGQIILPIGRHATQRKKMRVTDEGKARYAETRWKMREAWDRLSLLEFDIKTGRTHQIRVHCAAIRHPIVGDPVYGFKRPHKLFEDAPALKKIIGTVPRQMLHAWRLCLTHPTTNETIKFEAPVPDDMILFSKNIKACLKNNNLTGG